MTISKPFRIDNTAPKYPVMIDSPTGPQVPLALSTPFRIDNTAPKYPGMIDSPTGSQGADAPFTVQPRLTVRDTFGNSVVVDNIANRIVTVVLVPKGGRFAVAPPALPVLGQVPKSVCRADPEPFRGTFVIPVDLTTGEGTFTDLRVVQVMHDYKMRFSMTSSAGMTTNICNLSLPLGCSVYGPCMTEAEMVCADAYGNVQPSCETCFGSRCGFSPSNIPSTFLGIDCPGSICVRLNAVKSPRGAVLSSTDLNGGKDCSKQFCQVSVATGYARYTDLTMSVPGTTYVLKWYTQTKVTWEFESPPFNVTPPAPRVDNAKFSPDMSQVVVHFDRDVDVRDEKLRGAQLCHQELHQDFAESLGEEAYCTWTTRRALALSLGEAAYVNQTTLVRLADSSVITSTVEVGSILMTSLPATTEPERIVFGSPVGTRHPIS
ncbi:hypothetical protein T484DRAFT_1761742 [Baffinella frigidus]|nr:hypothetical protein T484DRAFT_1761742 [Cryptophyta sp. CCMP2293]